MALMDYKTIKQEVPLGPDNSFHVRGLDADDLTKLLSLHLGPISKAAALYAAHKESAFSNANLVTFFGVLATEFPGLVMEVISVAADEPEAAGIKIPLSAQIVAMSAIFKLTIEDVGGLGNLFATLAALAKGALQSASAESQKPNQSRGSIGA